jgi:hypothetical protein
MGEVGSVVLGLLTLAFVVWIKVVRPVRGDLAWKRQGERVAQAKARRLARHRDRGAPA